MRTPARAVLLGAHAAENGRLAIDERMSRGYGWRTTISREELQSKLDRGDTFFLTEMLPEEQHRHAYLPGAMNLRSNAVRESVPELLSDKDADIVVYCSKSD